jgi:hypothetical protein
MSFDLFEEGSDNISVTVVCTRRAVQEAKVKNTAVLFQRLHAVPMVCTAVQRVSRVIAARVV